MDRSLILALVLVVGLGITFLINNSIVQNNSVEPTVDAKKPSVASLRNSIGSVATYSGVVTGVGDGHFSISTETGVVTFAISGLTKFSYSSIDGAQGKQMSGVELNDVVTVLGVEALDGNTVRAVTVSIKQ